MRNPLPTQFKHNFKIIFTTIINKNAAYNNKSNLQHNKGAPPIMAKKLKSAIKPPGKNNSKIRKTTQKKKQTGAPNQNQVIERTTKLISKLPKNTPKTVQRHV